MSLDVQSAPSRPVGRGVFTVAPSRLGLGCASLGSRIGAREGLRALAAAHDAGVRWFDVAPAYGAGEAEPLLGRFLQGRRDRTIVTTKVGIAPPARLGTLKIAYSLGRPVAGAALGLRRAFRRLAATRNRRVPLDAELVEQSIADSLARLRIDHVDVYALHDPDASDVGRDEILRALERVVERGQARQIAIAGDSEACRAALRVGAPYCLLQMDVEDFAASEEFVNAPRRIILHSVLGFGGARDRLLAALAADPSHLSRLVAEGYNANAGRAAADLLLDNALALNPNGTVLASMFHPRHLIANLARANRPVSPRAPELLRVILG